MAVESKAQKLGQVIADFKRDLKYLQALLNLGTPLEKVAEHKGVIEEEATWLKESENEAKLITDVTAQILGSVVQDEKLEQLNT